MKDVKSRDAVGAEITINAPADRVFAAITDPRQRVQWWGVPGKFQVTQMESELRLGGPWTMSGTGGGKPFALKGEYTIIEPPRLLEFTWRSEWEPQTIVRFELTEKDGVTTVSVTHSGFADEEARGRYQGWPWLLSLLRSHVEAPKESA